MQWGRLAWVAGLALAVTGSGVVAETTAPAMRGVDIYNYFCYQCHGYAGDARTLASTYLDPKPRDFSRTSPDSLSRDAMLDAVTGGRPGTAMTSFSRVLTAAEIEQVVDFVRQEFMGSDPVDGRYHTTANGWPDHQRYAAAFPFATGAVSLDAPWELLTDGQRSGKRLYLTACISCHDRAQTNEKGPIWSPRAVSYPRRHYSHQHSYRIAGVDGLSGASTYALHERVPEFTEISPSEARGRALYLQNCAFCHAPDGSGRNWIGSFLEPHPVNLSGPRVAAMSERQLRSIIREGLSGTSMPAWKQILGQRQINDLIAYLKRAFAVADKPSPVIEQAASSADSAGLRWQRLRSR